MRTMEGTRFSGSEDKIPSGVRTSRILTNAFILWVDAFLGQRPTNNKYFVHLLFPVSLTSILTFPHTATLRSWEQNRRESVAVSYTEEAQQLVGFEL